MKSNTSYPHHLINKIYYICVYKINPVLLQISNCTHIVIYWQFTVSNVQYYCRKLNKYFINRKIYKTKC